MDTNKLAGMARSPNGKISAQRILALAWGLGVLLIWGYMSVKTGGLVPLPDQVVWITLGLSGFKVVQSFGENGKPLNMQLEKGQQTPPQ